MRDPEQRLFHSLRFGLAARRIRRRPGWLPLTSRLALLCVIGSSILWADTGPLMSKPGKNEKSPSREQVLWTETDVGYDLNAEYSYAGRAHIDFGNGHQGSLSEYYTDLKQTGTLRMFMAFLIYEGLEWQRQVYGTSGDVLVPHELDTLNAFLATDFRWSSHDQVRLQFEPGLYTDMHDVDMHDFNMPIALAYTRIPSKKLQWAIGLSINTWRGSRFLPGGGFRYYLTPRWKLNGMLPTPQIEYKANDYLHVWVGADFRGNTYRVSRRFGAEHNDPRLNDALVDYQEMRFGSGFSWNIRPLIELNGQAGYLFNRSFDYHDIGIHSSGQGAPYISLNVRVLLQLVRDKRSIRAQIRSMQYKLDFLQNFFKIPQ